MGSKQRWSAVSDKLFRAFVRPPFAGRFKAWAFIAILTLGLGVGDYVSGIEVSLSIFYLVPISLATGWLGPVAGTIVALASTTIRVASDLLAIYPEHLPAPIVWNMSAALVIFFFVVWLVHSLITLHHRLQSKVEAQHTALLESAADRQRLELEVLDVSTRERSAFGRELHDELGQHFVATAMAAQVLAQKLDDPARANEARAIVRWIEEGIAKTRKLARGLLLARIEPDRFLQELEELVATTRRSGVECRLTARAPTIDADAAECAQLFRIAQEAVGNALKHGRPRAIALHVNAEPDALALTIEDDGGGFDIARQPGTGMGLRIMQHRAKLIGAEVTVISAAQEGTRIVCRLPKKVAQFV